MHWPVSSSCRPITAASATCGCETIRAGPPVEGGACTCGRSVGATRTGGPAAAVQSDGMAVGDRGAAGRAGLLDDRRPAQPRGRPAVLRHRLPRTSSATSPTQRRSTRTAWRGRRSAPSATPVARSPPAARQLLPEVLGWEEVQAAGSPPRSSSPALAADEDQARAGARSAVVPLLHPSIAAAPGSLLVSMQLARAGGHLPHPRRAPPFVHASERRRVQAPDGRPGRAGGARRAVQRTPAYLTGCGSRSRPW